MSVAVETVLSLLFPPRCAVCGRPIRPQTYVCESCKAELARITAPYCPFCGMNTADCTCRKQPHAYSQVIAPFYYEGGVRQMLLALKYGGRQEGAAFLAEELMRELSARLFGCSFDLMTCIPTTRERIAERGYNQAESIAACIKPDPKTGFLQGTERDFRLLRKNRTTACSIFSAHPEGGPISAMRFPSGREKAWRENASFSWTISLQPVPQRRSAVRSCAFAAQKK